MFIEAKKIDHGLTFWRQCCDRTILAYFQMISEGDHDRVKHGEITSRGIAASASIHQVIVITDARNITRLGHKVINREGGQPVRVPHFAFQTVDATKHGTRRATRVYIPGSFGIQMDRAGEHGEKQGR